MSGEHNNEKESGCVKRDATDDNYKFSLDAYKAAATNHQTIDKDPDDFPQTASEKLCTICTMLVAWVTFPLWFPVAVTMICGGGRITRKTVDPTTDETKQNNPIARDPIARDPITHDRTVDPTVSDPDEDLIARTEARLSHQNNGILANITSKLKKDNANQDIRDIEGMKARWAKESPNYTTNDGDYFLITVDESVPTAIYSTESEALKAAGKISRYCYFGRIGQDQLDIGPTLDA